MNYWVDLGLDYVSYEGELTLALNTTIVLNIGPDRNLDIVYDLKLISIVHDSSNFFTLSWNEANPVYNGITGELSLSVGSESWKVTGSGTYSSWEVYLRFPTAVRSGTSEDPFGFYDLIDGNTSNMRILGSHTFYMKGRMLRSVGGVFGDVNYGGVDYCSFLRWDEDPWVIDTRRDDGVRSNVGFINCEVEGGILYGSQSFLEENALIRNCVLSSELGFDIFPGNFAAPTFNIVGSNIQIIGGSLSVQQWDDTLNSTLIAKDSVISFIDISGAMIITNNGSTLDLQFINCAYDMTIVDEAMQPYTHTTSNCQTDYAQVRLPQSTDPDSSWDYAILTSGIRSVTDEPSGPQPGFGDTTDPKYQGYETFLWGSSRTGIGTGYTVSSSAPEITTQPQDAIVRAGETVQFIVEATGVPAPSYEWSRDGVPLANGERISGVDTNTLQIIVEKADEGDYTVRVYNEVFPDAESNVATLAVMSHRAGPRKLTGTYVDLFDFTQDLEVDVDARIESLRSKGCAVRLDDTTGRRIQIDRAHLAPANPLWPGPLLR